MLKNLKRRLAVLLTVSLVLTSQNFGFFSGTGNNMAKPVTAYANEEGTESNAEIEDGQITNNATSSDQYYELDQSVTVDGTKIHVTADEGVFPEGCTVSAVKIEAGEDKQSIEEAVSQKVKEQDQGASVGNTLAFDIKVLDKKGNEIQPDTSKGNVEVKFAQLDMQEVKEKPEAELQVFHMDAIGENTEKLPAAVNKAEETVAVSADHFSVFIITLIYEGITNHDYYTTYENEYVSLSEILAGDGDRFRAIDGFDPSEGDYLSDASFASTDEGQYAVIEQDSTQKDFHVRMLKSGIVNINVTMQIKSADGEFTEYKSSVQFTIEKLEGAYSGVNGNVNWSLDENTGALNLSLVAEENEEMDWDKGTSIHSIAPWFPHADQIKSVTFSGTHEFTSIEDFAFSYCEYLTSVSGELGAVESIGISAFNDCHSLNSINLPGSVKTIGRAAFQACTSLTNITTGSSNELALPNALTAIGARAFQDCNSLAGSLTIPDNVTVDTGAFQNCTGITHVNIADIDASFSENSGGIIHYTNSAFNGCSGIQTVNILDGTGIGSRMFENCTALTSVVLPDTLTTIVSNSFRDCDKLETVRYQSYTGTQSSLPSGMKKIGGYAFYGCNALSDVTLLKEMEGCSINAYSFYKTSSSSTTKNTITAPFTAKPIFKTDITYNPAYTTINGQTTKQGDLIAPVITAVNKTEETEENYNADTSKLEAYFDVVTDSTDTETAYLFLSPVQEDGSFVTPTKDRILNGLFYGSDAPSNSSDEKTKQVIMHFYDADNAYQDRGEILPNTKYECFALAADGNGNVSDIYSTEITTGSYTYAPVLTPEDSEFEDSITVQFSDLTPGVSYHYYMSDQYGYKNTGTVYDLGDGVSALTLSDSAVIYPFATYGSQKSYSDRKYSFTKKPKF